MIRTTCYIHLSYLFLLSLFFVACNSKKKEDGPTIAHSTAELQQKTPELIKSYLEASANTNGKLDDLIQLTQFTTTRFIYEQRQYERAWSRSQDWTMNGDSLYSFIAGSRSFGLFPEDYHYRELNVIRKQIEADSLGKGSRKDAALWAKADILLTDAFVQLVRHVKLGRLGRDSITLRKDTAITAEYSYGLFQQLQKDRSVPAVFASLEPVYRKYHDLKAVLTRFLDSMDYKTYTIVPSPTKDRVNFKRLLQKRLFEGGFLATDTVVADSAQLAEAVRSFQKKYGLTVDGKAGEATIRMLNLSDKDKFIRIAISLDKFKLLPEAMPDQFIWVNLPGYYLQLWDKDSIRMYTKIICGKPNTRTPLLNSAISEIITYPQWTVPPSIIQKEILPAVKKNSAYLAKKGFSLVDKQGNVVSPDSVDWTKYSKGIPYRVVQGSGDANALGVLKFNFSNKYAVYLHDTNQRYLFGNAARALSHGCVRVQDWKSLADYIIRRDVNIVSREQKPTKLDSLNKWLANKTKQSLAIKNRLPLFIRYFTCDAIDGQLNFYEDIYGEDQRLQARYFASK